MRYIGIDLGTTNSTLSVANVNLNGEITPSSIEIRQPDKRLQEMLRAFVKCIIRLWGANVNRQIRRTCSINV
jgi:molecular chaperone DnaK (HSP70)